MAKIRYFLRSDFGTECDACGARFDITDGGTCVTCRRILCGAHLHGSRTRRLLVGFGAAPVCVDCRAGRSPEPGDAR